MHPWEVRLKSDNALAITISPSNIADESSFAANAGYESRFDHLRGSGGTLVPAEWSRAESDIDAMCE